MDPEKAVLQGEAVVQQQQLKHNKKPRGQMNSGDNTTETLEVITSNKLMAVGYT